MHSCCVVNTHTDITQRGIYISDTNESETSVLFGGFLTGSVPLFDAHISSTVIMV